jgi:hypothetical protein
LVVHVIKLKQITVEKITEFYRQYVSTTIQADSTSRQHKHTAQADSTSRQHKHTAQADSTSRQHKQTAQGDSTSRQHKQTAQAHRTPSHTDVYLAYCCKINKKYFFLFLLLIS